MSDFPEVAKHREHVIAVLVKEEKVSARHCATVSNKCRSLPDGVTGESYSRCTTPMGSPWSFLSKKRIKQGIALPQNWREQFDVKMQEQRERSQTAIKGAYSRAVLVVRRYSQKISHCNAPDVQSALRDVLGDHVVQRGSNITEPNVYVLISHTQKKLHPSSSIVLRLLSTMQIAKNLQISFERVSHRGGHWSSWCTWSNLATSYGNTVKVYSMKDPHGPADERPFSFEICGGPHVDHTSQLGEGGKTFKIAKEEASSAGIRRIKAVLI
jgi:alanyl-tRNA synthetase